MTEYLYHYTDDQGIEGIRRDMKIAMSMEKHRDAVLGAGVYLTDLPPTTDDDVLEQNNWGQVSPRYGMKIKWVVKIARNLLQGVRSKRLGHRVVYVYPREINLRYIRHKIEPKHPAIDTQNVNVTWPDTDLPAPNPCGDCAII